MKNGNNNEIKNEITIKKKILIILNFTYMFISWDMEWNVVGDKKKKVRDKMKTNYEEERGKCTITKYKKKEREDELDKRDSREDLNNKRWKETKGVQWKEWK